MEAAARPRNTTRRRIVVRARRERSSGGMETENPRKNNFLPGIEANQYKYDLARLTGEVR